MNAVAMTRRGARVPAPDRDRRPVSLSPFVRGRLAKAGIDCRAMAAHLWTVCNGGAAMTQASPMSILP